MERIAVYGTLKQGRCNHPVLSKQGAKFVGSCRIHGWVMYNLGAYPCIVPTKLFNTVFVEVYDVPNLRDTDRLEGYPSFYDRTIVTTDFWDAWVYFMREVPYRAKVINSGVWE